LRLESVTLSGFRCFGPDTISVSISTEITGVVGPNAAGKTALLQALAKLFGVRRTQRTIDRSDFHAAADADPDDRNPKNLLIDVLVALPELADGTATAETVAPSFRHMLITRKDKAPVCRLRLEARWEDDGTVEGEVAQDLYWVDTLDDDPDDDKKHAVAAADRGLIQLYYTPANRDAGAQVRATAGALAARLLRAVEWSDEVRESVDEATESLSGAFEGETAITAIVEALQKRWSTLHDEKVDTKPRLSLVSRRFEEVVSKIAVIFEQGPAGHERGLEALSDGQQSLFYFALVAAVFDMERKVATGKVAGFHKDQLRIPALSIFAIEEPEKTICRPISSRASCGRSVLSPQRAARRRSSPVTRRRC
jgi:putative ATP-dependent endonuclease of the OLD family